MKHIMPLLLLLFILIPFVEIYLLIRLYGSFGLLATIGIVLGTGVVGAGIAKWQGYRAVMRMQSELRQGVLPAQALGDGVLIFAAGVMLITPGLLSDISGLLLLIPPVRKLVLKGLRTWLSKNVRVTAQSFHTRTPAKSTIVDAKVIEARVVDPQRDET